MTDTTDQASVWRFDTAHDVNLLNRLGKLPDAPAQIWTLGRTQILTDDAPVVAIVGARACTEHGAHIARRMAADLSHTGVTVIAGGALGIDTAAHIGALSAHGNTVAVMPCGLDVTYPASNKALFNRIRAGGLMLSEYEPGSQPRREQFLRRNALIAAIADLLVVVEGGARSGTLSATSWANRLGTPIAAVEPVDDSPTTQLPSNLLAQGAAPVRSAADVLTALSEVHGS